MRCILSAPGGCRDRAATRANLPFVPVARPKWLYRLIRTFATFMDWWRMKAFMWHGRTHATGGIIVIDQALDD